MTEQLSMFEAASPARSKGEGLLLLHLRDQRLTKAQETFNKRVLRVEGLRAKLERETARLDGALAYFGEHIHPRLQRLSELRKDLIRGIAPLLTDKHFKRKREREALREILAGEIDELLQLEGSLEEDDLREIFERVHGVNFHQVQQENLEDARLAMESMFYEMGVDVDLSTFGPDMNEADLAVKTAEIAGKLQEQHEAEQRARRAERPGRRKGDQQLGKKRQLHAEELRKKTISSIYKQLAKVLHPDLETDTAVRQQKVALMQELTVAYRNNDMHTLLRLELKWIQNEQGDLTRLSDEKLSIYNQVLKEQADDLEQEIAALVFQPRYQPLAVEDGPFTGVSLRTDGPAEAFLLDKEIAGIEANLARISAGKAHEVVRNMRAEW